MSIFGIYAKNIRRVINLRYQLSNVSHEQDALEEYKRLNMIVIYVATMVITLN